MMIKILIGAGIIIAGGMAAALLTVFIWVVLYLIAGIKKGIEKENRKPGTVMHNRHGMITKQIKKNNNATD